MAIGKIIIADSRIVIATLCNYLICKILHMKLILNFSFLYYFHSADWLLQLNIIIWLHLCFYSEFFTFHFNFLFFLIFRFFYFCNALLFFFIWKIPKIINFLNIILYIISLTLKINLRNLLSGDILIWVKSKLFYCLVAIVLQEYFFLHQIFSLHFNYILYRLFSFLLIFLCSYLL